MTNHDRGSGTLLYLIQDDFFVTPTKPPKSVVSVLNETRLCTVGVLRLRPQHPMMNDFNSQRSPDLISPLRASTADGNGCEADVHFGLVM